jgi:hypothetical protein
MTQTPTPSITMPSSAPVTGHAVAHGQTDTAMPIPAGARSVVVDFQCTGGAWYRVDLGDATTPGNATMLSEAPYHGMCGGVKKLAWPLPARTEDWSAAPHFSTDDFKRDAAVTTDCKKFSWIMGELSDADSGYGMKAFGADEWRTRVDQAATELAAAASASQSPLKGALAQLEPLLRAPSLPAGSTLSVAQPTATQVGNACTANQTVFVVQAHYGG